MSEEGWQPIETAPKDGTRIWLGWPGSVAVGNWDTDNPEDFGGPEWEWGWARHYNGSAYDGPPTHWQPYFIPPPPKAKAHD